MTFCAYCVSPMPDDVALCPTCWQPTGVDAPLELDIDEWVRSRGPCPKCAKPIHPLAVRCAWCDQEIRR